MLVVWKDTTSITGIISLDSWIWGDHWWGAVRQFDSDRLIGINQSRSKFCLDWSIRFLIQHHLRFLIPKSIMLEVQTGPRRCSSIYTVPVETCLVIVGMYKGSGADALTSVTLTWDLCVVFLKCCIHHTQLNAHEKGKTYGLSDLCFSMSAHQDLIPNWIFSSSALNLVLWKPLAFLSVSFKGLQQYFMDRDPPSSVQKKKKSIDIIYVCIISFTRSVDPTYYPPWLTLTLIPELDEIFVCFTSLSRWSIFCDAQETQSYLI